MRKKEKISAFLVLILFAIGIYVYDMMPGQIASHWDAAGNVNGYMGKFWGVFFVPVISLFLLLLLTIIPRIDPKRKNIEGFADSFDNFVLMLVLFIGYIYSLTIFWNLGYRFDFILMLLPAFSILVYSIGVILSKTRSNWTIGIRTPWTLTSDVVWQKTHEFAAKLFKGSAVIALFGVFYVKLAIWFIIVPILASSLASVVYSYFTYVKEKK